MNIFQIMEDTVIITQIELFQISLLNGILKMIMILAETHLLLKQLHTQIGLEIHIPM